MPTLSHYPNSVRVVRRGLAAIAERYGKGAAYAMARLSADDRRQFASLLWRMRAVDAHERLRVVQVADNQVGCALQYSPTGKRPWTSVSFHDSVADAVQAFQDVPPYKDKEVAHYRIEQSESR